MHVINFSLSAGIPFQRPLLKDSEPLDRFIDELERITVKQTWAGQVLGEVNYYQQHKDRAEEEPP